MLIIPAIDLRGGVVVRLRQGKRDEETVYSHDPIAIAQGWEKRGAKWLHVIDLDGAFSGRPKNFTVLARMAKEVEIPIEFGGGIRSIPDIKRAIEAGVARVILGSAALTDPGLVKRVVRKYGKRIAIAIDAREGRVCTFGWKRDSESTPLELAKTVASLGVERIIYTDILRDGTLKGPNIEMTMRIAQKTGLKVIASGGVSTLAEIEELKKLEKFGIEGVIIGKALYERRIELKEAIQVTEEKE